MKGLEVRVGPPTTLLDSVLLVVGVLPFTTAFAAAGISAVAFSCGHSMLPGSLGVSAALALAAVAALARRSGMSRAAVAIGAAIAVALALLGVALALQFLDTSDDGQGYHLSSIVRLAHGWNPWREAILPGATPNSLWLEHYPRAAYTLGAAIYMAANHLEAAKASNLVLLFSAFCLALAAARTVIRSGSASLVAALAAANPVAVYQLWCDYVDGQLASSLTALIASAVLVVTRPSPLVLLGLVSALVHAVGLKFTGLVYACSLAAGMTIVAVALRRPAGARRLALASATALGVAVLALHANPYVTNTRDHGHPFFPIAGARPLDIMSTEMSPVYAHRNGAERLFISLFARSGQPPYSAPNPNLKVPFSVYPSEFAPFRQIDCRAGGFGPLFGGVLLLSMAIFALGGCAGRIGAMGSVVVLASALINPHAWWARYAPQIWLIPVIAVAAGFASARRAARGMGMVAGVVLVMNVLWVAVANIGGQHKLTVRASAQLAALQARPQPVPVAFRYYEDAHRARLQEHGIRILPVPWDACRRYSELVNSDTRICEAGTIAESTAPLAR